MEKIFCLEIASRLWGIYVVIEYLLSGLLILVSVWSLAFFAYNIKKSKLAYYIPVSINLSALLTITLVPFWAIRLNFNFKTNLIERQKVVTMIISGELQNSYSEHDAIFVQLPKEYKHLSRNYGNVMVDCRNGTTRVLFYMADGILDNFEGFMYTTGECPKIGDFDAKFLLIEPKGQHWFYVIGL
ncbi:MAG: hypothetical protein HZA48_04830 [Planctomycetes bacterium]|nr:hypothetical protein [Planctomycetota bacterium]